MTGWCPIHDRVYDAPDGLCPRCGSALVDESSERDALPDEKEQVAGDPADATVRGREGPRVASKVSTRTGIAVVAVAVAFAVGVAFPRGGTREAPRAPRTEVRSDITLGVVGHDAGVSLRLESFSQQGRHVVARFRVVQGDLAVGSLRDAEVVLFSGSTIVAEVVLQIRTTVSGFILEGDALDDATIPVTGLGIRELGLDSSGADSVRMDLTGVWPVSRATEPRARKASGTLDLGDSRTVRLTGLVGWADRLEVALRVDGAVAGRIYDDSYDLEFGAESVGGTASPRTEGGALVIVFEGVPASARAVTLRIVHKGMGLRSLGGWVWRFGGG